MEDEGFMEVETSILSGQAGGAVALRSIHTATAKIKISLCESAPSCI